MPAWMSAWVCMKMDSPWMGLGADGARVNHWACVGMGVWKCVQIRTHRGWVCIGMSSVLDE